LKTNRADEAEMNWPNLDRSDVKRRAMQTGVFFLIGATINIAVAWGCAFWAAPASTLDSWDSEVHKPNLAAAWVGQPEGFPERSIEGSVCPPQAGYQWLTLYGDDGVDIGEPLEDWWPADVFSLEMIEAGWPFASFVGGLWQRQPRRPEGSFDIDLWEYRAILVDFGSSDFPFDDCTIIPLMPKWLGFLANTIFFGGIVFLLFRLSSTLRQQVTKGACREGGISTVGGLP